MTKYKLDTAEPNWWVAESSNGYANSATDLVDGTNPGFYFWSDSNNFYVEDDGSGRRTNPTWATDTFTTSLGNAAASIFPTGNFSNTYQIIGTTGSSGQVTIQNFDSTAPVAAVPEPSSAIAMGLLGLVGIAGNRLRRRTSATA